MDMSLVIKALEEYEKFKGLIPAIKAEYESVVKMIEKVKEIYKIEKQAYDDLVSKKVSLEDEIKIQKDLWLKEYTEGKADLAKISADAAEIMRVAALAKAEIEQGKAALEKAKSDHKSLVEKFEENLVKLKEVIKHIF